MQLGPSELSRLFSGSPYNTAFYVWSMFRYVPLRFPTFRYVPVFFPLQFHRYAPLRSATFRFVLGFSPYNSAF